jgi:DNA repair exonuclease SbcCD nuclease subunit
MKIALVTDTHWGVRNDNSAFHRYFDKFYSEVFFPYLRENGINDIIHLGDIVDRRKYINFISARALRKQFIEPALAEFNLHVIIGNHDTYYKNTNSVNAMEELFWMNTYHNFCWYESAEEVSFGDCKILFVPWICADNHKSTMELIDSTEATIAFGHLELAGFAMYRGHQAMDGENPNVFEKFDLVASGHYHTRSNQGNIHYLGAPCEYTWSDFNDPRGFHIFDTETRELTFVQNPITMFKKIFYDDDDLTLEEIMDFDTSAYKDTIVKVVVKSKNNPYWFDMFIDKLETSGTVDLQVVEDHMNLNLEDEQDIVDEAEDTLTILKKYVSNLDIKGVNPTKLQATIAELYDEALTLE